MVTTVGRPPVVLVSLGALTPMNLPTREKILPATLPATETLGEGAAGAAGASASGLLAVSTFGLVAEGVEKPSDGAGGATDGAGGATDCAVPAAVETDNGELAGAPPGFPNPNGS